MDSHQTTTIFSIQHLRGIAALLVVWHHAREQIVGLANVFPSSFGASGVDIFFVISGFIMVVTTTGRATTPLQFMGKRIARVVPLYWLLTLSMVCLWMIKPAVFRTLVVSETSLLQSLFFIPHFSAAFPAQAWPLLVPGWTLNYEMFFYLAFALTLFFPKRWRLMGITLVFSVFVASGAVFGPFNSAAIRTYTDPLLLEFLAGAWIGYLWTRHQFALPRSISLGCVLAGFSLLVARNWEVFGVFTQILGATLLVAGALNYQFPRFMNSPLHALGDASYSLYLTHIFTLGIIRSIWIKLNGATQSVYEGGMFMLISMGACIVVGLLVFRFIESPMTVRINRLFFDRAPVSRARS